MGRELITEFLINHASIMRDNPEKKQEATYILEKAHFFISDNKWYIVCFSITSSLRTNQDYSFAIKLLMITTVFLV